MKERNTFRFRNPEIQTKTASLLKEKNISFNQFVNDLIDDYFTQNGDKTYLQNINESMNYIKGIVKDNAQLERKNTLILGRCLTLSLLENSKNLIQMKERNIDPSRYYGTILPDSTKLLDGEHEFYKALQEFVENYHTKK